MRPRSIPFAVAVLLAAGHTRAAEPPPTAAEPPAAPAAAPAHVAPAAPPPPPVAQPEPANADPTKGASAPAEGQPQAPVAEKKPVAVDAFRPADESLAQAARELFENLLGQRIDAVASACRLPFYFEGKSLATADEVKKRWVATLEGKPLGTLKLYGIELLTLEEMTQKHGKIPDRLNAWPVRNGILSVANLGGRAAVVLWKKGPQGWQALAFHD